MTREYCVTCSNYSSHWCRANKCATSPMEQCDDWYQVLNDDGGIEE